jgi:dipeptidyl aminopeptidase/acylaminoacyl peptidase
MQRRAERMTCMSTPDVRDLILLESVLEVRLNTRGDRAALRIEHPRWDENRYCRDVLVADVESGRHRRLTRFAVCDGIRWLDDDTLAVLKSDGSPDDKPQVYVYEGLVGDGWQVTQAGQGVEAFEPFADGIVFVSVRSGNPATEKREDRFGSFVHVEAELGRRALHYVDLPRLADYERASARAQSDERKRLVRPQIELGVLLQEQVAIQGVVVSPVSDSVYVNAMPTDDLTRERESSVHQISLNASAALEEFLRRESAGARSGGEVGVADDSEERRDQEDRSYLGHAQRLVLPARASIEAVSPDGGRLLVRFPGRDARMSTNAELWAGDRDALLAAATPEDARRVLRDVTTGVDQSCFAPVWHDLGIDVMHADSTKCSIRRLDPDGIEPPRRLDTGDVFCQWAFHTNRNGQLGLVGGSATEYDEAWVCTDDGFRQLTHLSSQLEGWDLGEVTTITWTSKDGTEIEGVLRTPPDFDPSRRYPLAFVVHGGPTWFDSEQLLPKAGRLYYPEVQLAAQGVLVLHPNYRGSLGRGLHFQELNVGNLGVGDLWDLESGIDHLDQLGWVDTARVGCMGWSQGGYISAFAALHSDRFAAVSVGAGVSDWYTYAISNDVPDFTRDFLGVELFGQDRSALTASSPIAAISRARTPTLIQHGGKDQRVPLSNAMELYRGLRERGVQVELFVYPDFEHPITKPRENHAVAHQNLAWFRHWLLGEELVLEPTT